MTMFRRRITTAVGTVAVLGVVLTGCSDSKSAAPTTSSDSTATGTPILIGTEMPLTGQLVVQPELKAGMEAAVSAINAAGGIHGHPLKLQVCDTKFETNTELSCMRSLIAAKVSAIVGGTIAADVSGREFELASKAGIPFIGSAGDVPAEFTTPGVFPLSSGSPGWVYGGTKNLTAKGATKIGLLALNNAVGNYDVTLANAALASQGIKPTSTALADPQADPTFASAAAKAAANGVDGIFLMLAPPLMPKALTALKNAGYNGMTATLSALASPAIIKAAGAAAEGMLVTAQAAFPSDTHNPGITALLADMKKYQPNSDVLEITIQGWSAVKLVEKVLSAIPGTDAPTATQILTAFNGITTPIQLDTIGPFGPPPAKPYAPGFDRMYSPTVQNGHIKDGILQPDGKGFLNAFTGA